MEPVGDEGTLWRAACERDADAFAEVYERHADSIYRYVFRRLGDWADAEDTTAVVFLEAYRRRDAAVLVDGRILPWLYGIATNVVRNRRRTLRRHRQALARIGPPAVAPDFAPEATARVAAVEEARALLAEVARLSSEQQDVVALCLWHEVSYEDAAVALGIPVGTVRSRLARARTTLQRRSRSATCRGEGEVTS